MSITTYPAASAGQPLDATLTALAGLATGANQLPYSTGTDTFTQTPLTAAGRAVLDDADAAAQRTTLGLGTVATQAYEEGSFTVTATGMTTTVTGTAFYVRVGKQITVNLPPLSGTSNATTCTLTGWPAGFAPVESFHVWAKVVDNGVNLGGMLQFLSSGVCNVFPNVVFGAWTASGSKQVQQPVLTYRAA